MTREEYDIWQSAGIFIRSRIEGLCNDRRFIEAEELEQAYKCINEHFDNALDFDINFKPVILKEPETGHWIPHIEHCNQLGLLPSGLGSYYWCSECDCGVESKHFHLINYNYCPNCGAKMEVEHEID